MNTKSIITLYIVHYTVYIVHYYTIHYTISNVLCTHYTVHYPLYTVYSVRRTHYTIRHTHFLLEWGGGPYGIVELIQSNVKIMVVSKSYIISGNVLDTQECIRVCVFYRYPVLFIYIGRIVLASVQIQYVTYQHLDVSKQYNSDPGTYTRVLLHKCYYVIQDIYIIK